MAGVIDLGARQREMYMQQMGRLFSTQDDFSRELDRQAEQDVREAAEKRLEEQSKANIAAAQARVGQGAERTKAYTTAQAEAAQAHRAAVLKALADIEQGGQKVDIARERLEAQKPVYATEAEKNRALTGQAGAHTELFKTQTQAEREKAARAVEEDLVKHDNRGMAFAISQATRGQPFTPEETNDLERKFQRFGGDKFFTLPRNPDGSWKYDPKTVARDYPIFDSKGMPTTKLANDLRTVDKPYSNYGQELADYDKISKDPNATIFEKRMAGDRIVKSSTPAVGGVLGEVAQGLVDTGNVDAAINLIKDSMTKWGAGKVGKMPSAASQTDLNARLALVQSMNENIRHFQLLKQAGMFPTGALRKPLLDTLEETGLSNPYVSAFNAELNAQLSQYMNLQHGRRFMESELNFIKHAMPSNMYATNAFEEVAKSMRQHMIDDIRSRVGTMKAWNLQVPDIGIEPIDPAESIRQGLELPDIETNDGMITSEQSRKRALEIQSAGDLLRRSGMDIGGMGAFRGSPTAPAREEPGALGQIGMTVAPEPSKKEQDIKAAEDAEVERLSHMSAEDLQKELDSMKDQVWHGGAGRVDPEAIRDATKLEETGAP